MSDHRAAARLLRNARREAVLVGLVWLLALTWTVGYCYLFGYAHPADSWPVRLGLVGPSVTPPTRLVAGLPAWVAYGIACPWLVCSLVTVAFALFVVRDDDLGTEAEGEPE